MKRKYLNRLSKLAIVAAVISITSCRDEDGMAPEYMPDMYRSPAVEPYVDYGELRGNYSDAAYTDKMTARQSVEGTIPRGFVPYGYDNTAEGYELAGTNLKNPVAYTDKVAAEGKELYGMFCVHCHGKTGQGDGSIVQNDKFPPLPVKFAPGLDISEGKMFHTITYGKGLMGSHASQLNQEERWKLVHYIRSEFLKEAHAQTSSSNGEGDVAGDSTTQQISFTGDLANDLDLIFDFFDEENPNYDALPTRSPSVILKGVYFGPASYKITMSKSKETLESVVAALTKSTKVKVELAGHTDHGSEDESINVNLSKNRANAVKEHLVKKGIAESRISVVGFGSSQPIASNEDAEGKAKNRRTEITVIK